MSLEWIQELCPEIAEWQAEMIWEKWKSDIAAERDGCTEKLFESMMNSARIERENCARLVQTLVDMRVPASKYAEAIRKGGGEE